MITALISAAIFAISVIVLDCLTQKYDKQRVLYRPEALAACISAMTLLMVVFLYINPPIIYALFGGFFGGQICAALMDAKDMEVADIYHIWSFVSVAPLILLGFLAKFSLWNVVIFVLIQFVFRFFNAYAESDVFAFILMSLLVYTLGGTLVVMVAAQLVAYVYIFIPNLIRGNVNKKGNLKEVKAFIPYIYLAESTILCILSVL